MRLILLRHGESEWNLLNQFTGWTDVGLTDNGIKEAQFSAEQILKKNIVINTIYTSFEIRKTDKEFLSLIFLDIDNDGHIPYSVKA